MGKFNDLLIEIGVDTKSAKKGIQELDKMFDGLGKSFVGATRKKPPKDPFNIGAERMKMQKYIRELKSLGQETEHYQKQLKGLKNQSQFSAMKKQLDGDKKALMKFKDDVSKENLRDVKKTLATNKKLEDTEKAKEARAKVRHTERQQHKGKIRQQKIKDQNKMDAAAQNSLKQRLAGYKKEKRAVEAVKAAKINAKTKLQNRADSYEENFRTSRAYQGMNEKQRAGMEGKIRTVKTQFILTGNTRGFKELNRDAVRFRQELRKLNVVQSGLNDSTRNMIRSYASLFALMEGTNAIKNIGMDFQGMEASMLAATGGEKAAAKDMQFLNGMVDKMGLNLKDTTDAWVKFKFAANGKIDQSQMEDIFTGLSMFGTSLKVDTESMKRSQKAIIQMMSKGKVMAEELRFLGSF